MYKENICEVLEENNIDILSIEGNIINIIYEFDDIELKSAKAIGENEADIKDFLVELAEDDLSEIVEEIEEEFNIVCNLKQVEYTHLNCIKYELELHTNN